MKTMRIIKTIGDMEILAGDGMAKGLYCARNKPDFEGDVGHALMVLLSVVDMVTFQDHFGILHVVPGIVLVQLAANHQGDQFVL